MATTGQTYGGLDRNRIGPLDPASWIALLATVLVVLPYLSPLALLGVAEIAVLTASFFLYTPLLYLTIFLLPMAPLISVEEFPVHDLVALTRIVMFVGVFARKFMDRESLGSWLWGGGFEKLNVVYCVIALVSAAVANPLEPSASHALFRLISYVGLFYVVTGWVRSESQLRAVLATLFVSTMATCIMGFAQFAAADYGDWHRALYAGQEEYLEPWVGRITSVFLHTNPYAGYLNLILPLAVAVWHSETFSRRFRLAARVCFFIFTVTFMLVQSRGAFLGYVLAVWIALRYIVKTKPEKKIFLFDVAMAVGIGAVLASIAGRMANLEPGGVSMTLWERLTTLDDSTLLRLWIYASAWGMFTSSPLFGIGYGNFRSHLTPMMGDAPSDVWDTHNIYLKLLSETGILGFACFMGFIFVLVRMALRSCKERFDTLESAIGGALLAATATVLIHGIVEVMNEVPQYGSMLWLLFALYLVARRLNSQPPVRSTAG